MSPNKWLLLLTIILTGCDEAAQDAADEDEDTAVESVDSCFNNEGYSSCSTGDFGPENTWWHTDASSLPDGLMGTGFRTGDTAHDFILRDQNGDQVQLYQFYGQVIVLNVFVEWAYNDENTIHTAEQMWMDMQDDGFVYLSVMFENSQGQPPSIDNAAAWASHLGLTHPVLVDPTGSQNVYARIAYPTLVVIDREMTIIEDDFWPLNPQWLAEIVLN